MSTLHNQGKVRRAKGLMLPSMPIYFLFTSDAADESSVIVPTTILGATIATTKQLIGPNSGSGTTAITIDGTSYKSYSTSTADAALATDSAYKIYIEGLLDTNSVVANAQVKTIYVVSHVQGVVPAGATYLTAANITAFSNFGYVVEAVHKLATPITMTSSIKKLIGMILEM